MSMKISDLSLRERLLLFGVRGGQSEGGSVPGGGEGSKTTPGYMGNQPSGDWGSMAHQFPGEPGQGGTGKMGSGNYASLSSKGYGMMPTGSGPLAEAIQYNPHAFSTFSDPLTAYWNSQKAKGAAEAWGAAQQEHEQNVWKQQLEYGNLKNQAIQRLLSLFGTGGAGGANPFLAGIQGGPVTADPRILAAEESKVKETFERPGGLRSQLQQTAGRQGRFSESSTMGAQRQAALDLAMSRGMTEAYLPAQKATVEGYQPTLQAADIWGRQNITPSLIANLLAARIG